MQARMVTRYGRFFACAKGQPVDPVQGRSDDRRGLSEDLVLSVYPHYERCHIGHCK